jgi:hypothetical protein
MTALAARHPEGRPRTIAEGVTDDQSDSVVMFGEEVPDRLAGAVDRGAAACSPTSFANLAMRIGSASLSATGFVLLATQLLAAWPIRVRHGGEPNRR